MTPKKGDGTKCIKASSYSILKKGKIYIFEGINEAGNFIISDNGKILPYGFFPHRFELMSNSSCIYRRLLR